MLGWMLGSLMGTASHANARVDAFRDARAAMQMMERDLRNLVRTQWNPDPFTNPTLPASTVDNRRNAASSLFCVGQHCYTDPARPAISSSMLLSQTGRAVHPVTSARSAITAGGTISCMRIVFDGFFGT